MSKERRENKTADNLWSNKGKFNVSICIATKVLLSMYKMS